MKMNPLHYVLLAGINGAPSSGHDDEPSADAQVRDEQMVKVLGIGYRFG